MCSRLCLSTGLAEIKHHFDVVEAPPLLAPHWNIAPGGPLPVIRVDIHTLRRRLDLMRWGLVPRWAMTLTVVRTTANAGSLELDRQWRRCIVPVNNFYEWRLSDRQPFAVGPANGQLMPLAGIWDLWTSPTGALTLCVAILTTGANPLLQSVCKDMPAILDPEDWALWLGSEISADRPVSAAIRSCPDHWLRIWPIDRRIRSRKNDGPFLLEPSHSPPCI